MAEGTINGADERQQSELGNAPSDFEFTAGDEQYTGATGSTDGGVPIIDPANLNPPKRRGRKPGSGRKPGTATGTSAGTGTSAAGTGKPEAEKKSALVADLEELLISVHVMGAEFFKSPEFALEREEARRLSDSIKEVGKHYDLPLDPKKVAVVGLVLTGLSIYGPRIMILSKRERAPVSPKVVPMRPAPASPPASPAPAQPPARPAASILDALSVSPGDVDRMARAAAAAAKSPSDLIGAAPVDHEEGI